MRSGLIDSTHMPLSSLSETWASYGAASSGTKLHVVYDPNAATPVHFAVTAARINDITAAKAMPIEAGVTHVFDLGYYDFGWWAGLDAKGCRFVTRLKTNTPTRVQTERTVTPGGAILADRIVRLPERLKASRRNPCARDLREIHVRLDTGKTLRIVSNDLDAPAEEIAGLYKTRWQIELFFRWVKQTLKIRRFLGTSENAVRVQLAVALIAYLLLRMAHAAQTTLASLLTFTRLVRLNMFQFRSIHDLADPARLPRTCLEAQLELKIC